MRASYKTESWYITYQTLSNISSSIMFLEHFCNIFLNVSSMVMKFQKFIMKMHSKLTNLCTDVGLLWKTVMIYLLSNRTNILYPRFVDLVKLTWWQSSLPFLGGPWKLKVMVTSLTINVMLYQLSNTHEHKSHDWVFFLNLLDDSEVFSIWVYVYLIMKCSLL